MKQVSNKNNKGKSKTSGSDKNYPKPPYGGYGFNWLYFLFLGLLLWFSIFSNSVSGTKEINWSFLQDTLLAQQEVARIVVVNKEFAEIHIKKDRLGDPRHKEVSEKLFSAEAGPQYRMTIGSVETFEDKLQRAQEER